MSKPKVYELNQCHQAFLSLAKVQLPIKISWDLLEYFDNITPEIARYQKANDQIIIKYGKRLPNTDQYHLDLKDENTLKLANDEFMILIEQRSKFDKVAFDIKLIPDNVSMTPEHLKQLRDFFKNDTGTDSTESGSDLKEIKTRDRKSRNNK